MGLKYSLEMPVVASVPVLEVPLLHQKKVGRLETRKGNCEPPLELYIQPQPLTTRVIQMKTSHIF